MQKNTNSTTHILAALLFSLGLSACGGGGSDTSQGGNNSQGNTPQGNNSACSGTPWLTPSYAVYTGGTGAVATPTTKAAAYYGSNMSAPVQCISINDTLQATTTDNFNSVNWLDPIGSTNNGAAALRVNGNLLLTCTAGSDATKHLAIRNSTGTATFNNPTMVGNNFAFESLECSENGNNIINASTKLQFDVQKGVSIIEASGNNALTPTEVQEAFSPIGFTTPEGTIIRWTLYVLPTSNGMTKQVIAHTGTKTNGKVEIFAFVQP